MPKFEVTAVETRTLIFEIEAINKEAAAEKAQPLNASFAKSNTLSARNIEYVCQAMTPQQRAFKMQIDNIRNDYNNLQVNNKLPSGEKVDDETSKTMQEHLISLHDQLIKQASLDLPLLSDGIVETHLGETTEFFKAHLGDPTKEHIGDPTKPTVPQSILDMDEEEVWEKAATKLGWHFDSDYKGWVKPSNMKEGARPGEWDAYVRDLSAEDACNEESIETIDEAREILAV